MKLRNKQLLKYYQRFIKMLSRTGIGKSRYAQLAANFLYHHLRPDFVEIDGNKIFLDPRDTHNLIADGVHEDLETQTVKHLVKNGDTAVDIGANLGYYSLLIAKLVGNDGKVFSFEPEPHTFLLLKKNITTNGYRNVVLVQKALSNIAGKKKLYLSEGHGTTHTLFDTKEKRKTMDVSVTSLDEYFKDDDLTLNFIKMDAEGSEIAIVEGMGSVLKKQEDLIIITEFCPYWIKKFGRDAKEFLEILLQNNFKLYEINEQQHKIIAVDVSKLLSEYPPEKSAYTNLLCIKGRSPSLLQQDLVR